MNFANSRCYEQLQNRLRSRLAYSSFKKDCHCAFSFDIRCWYAPDLTWQGRMLENNRIVRQLRVVYQSSVEGDTLAASERNALKRIH